jgi:hypothetical protein
LIGDLREREGLTTVFLDTAMAALDPPTRPSRPSLPEFTRYARHYAPEPVMAVLGEIVGAARVGIVIDVDALERSALAKIDRVMVLALDALAGSGIKLVLAAREAAERAALLERALGRAEVVDVSDAGVLKSLRVPDPQLRLIVLSDNPAMFERLAFHDCGIALGRPELTRANIATVGDTAVRATLWWLAEEHARLLAS